MIAHQQLGKYHVEEHIGSGAYADVYRATDGTLKRTVALKVLKPMLMADQEAFARFVQEAQTAAGLFHPHIATVLDLGEAEGCYFIAMRYINGPSLDKLLAERGPLPWEDALRITGQIAEALQFAHDKDLIHRDVKPQNILVSEDEGAVLTDFGLVKAMASSGLTTTGSFLGTPNYMAPEIWKDEAITPAVDQYALACVLVEMLSGQVLFDGSTPPAVMAKHFQAPLLSEDWAEKAADCDILVVQKALAHEASQRFGRIGDFYVALNLDKTSEEPQEPKIEILPHPEETQTPEMDFSKYISPDNPAGIEWVEIPAGEFQYGDEKKPFYIRKIYKISKFPVTNAQYSLFLKVNNNVDAPQDWDHQKCIYPPGKENHPVVYVSWEDAQAFCLWAGCRLPTEQEWEKAARGSDGRTYPWGEDWIDGKYCNSEETGIGTTTPVDEFPEGISPQGVLDMSGNVLEWTVSKYDSKSRVLRGGAFNLYQLNVRCASRYGINPTLRNFNYGFRVCALPPSRSAAEHSGI
jgi:serine/threonine protein kinase